MAYTRKPRKPRKARRKPRRMAKSGLRTTIQKVLTQQLEKKRYTICPTSTAQQTIGDIAVNRPTQVILYGGNANSYPTGTPLPFLMGQSYNTTTVANAGGWSSVDITPIPLQDNTTSGRVGSQITLTSAFIKFNVNQQSSTVLYPVNLKILIVLNVGPSVSALQAMTDMYQNNPFTYSSANTSGFIDYNSSRQPDNFKNYKVIRQMNINVPVDSISNQLMSKSATMKIRYNRGKGHRIRFLQNNTTDTYTNISAGQLFMFFLADAGNANPTVAQLTSTNSSIIGSTLVGSGLSVNYHLTHYYTDS